MMFISRYSIGKVIKDGYIDDNDEARDHSDEKNVSHCLTGYLSINTGGNYSLSASGEVLWLTSGPFGFSSSGQWRTTDGGTLSIKNETYATSGTGK